jgi:pimeloyl-ACP methyl ester carboxylesterase
VKTPPPQFLSVGAGDERREIAVLAQPGKGPPVVWLGGLRSDMRATKAEALAAWAERTGRSFIRFDYAGHGESSGDFADWTMSHWLEDAQAVLAAHTRGPAVLVGSSMGGWVALLATLRLRQFATRQRPAGLVLIAPAVDFTEELMWKRMPPEIQQQITDTGAWTRPSAYEPAGYPITRALIEEGRNHLMLGGMIETGCPVRILQGVKDEDVPWQHAVELSSRFARDDVVLTLVKDGDHRLSRPEDIERLIAAVKELSGA